MKRLDIILVDRQYCTSRSQALHAIRSGYVEVEGHIVTKPGQKFSEDCEVKILGDNLRYVSRAALKLLPFLENCEGKIALDLGASTGGFTQVLLEKGAKFVFAVDVGHGQFHESLRTDQRVALLEKTNVKSLNSNSFEQELWPDFSIITADLSFISLTKALPASLALAKSGVEIYALIKPQFELEPSVIGKNGVVKSQNDNLRARDKIAEWFERQNWNVMFVHNSPVLGSDGNQEYIIKVKKP